MDAQILKSLKEKVHKLPMQPGVYIMKDKNNTVIYVGKAKKLKNRVSSYFRAIDHHLPKVYKMVQNVVILTTSSPTANLKRWCWSAA